MDAKVTVDLKDLRLLVKLLFACSVESQAQKLLRLQQPKGKRAVVTQYVEAVRELVPSAKKIERARYAEILSSMRSGQNVPAALASFVTREAKSTIETETKSHPPR